MTEVRPFFVSPGTLPGPRRRLLLVSYHFPPSSAAGALRWRKLAGIAADRGWDLDVITLDPANLPRGAAGDGLADLPSGTRVFGVPQPVLQVERVGLSILTAARRFRKRAVQGWRSGTNAVPSAATNAVVTSPGALARVRAAVLDHAVQGRWSRWAAALGSRLTDQVRYDAVITCGPPHMVHVAGQRVAAAHNLPLIIDLRDPWRLVERLAATLDSPVWRWHAAWHERRAIPRANLIVMNTEPARDAMRARYPAEASRIIAVMNGADEEQLPSTERPVRFTVTYAGSIYLDRDPRPLFDAARQVVERRSLSPAEFGITLVGNVHRCGDALTEAVARDFGLEEYVELLPQRPRVALLPLLARTAVLVSLAQDSHMAIPSKVYEYMQFDAWLLALAEPHSATARLLAGSAADVVSGGDIPSIAAVVEKRYDQYRRGEYPVRLATDPRFSRRSQAAALFEALERCVRPTRRP